MVDAELRNIEELEKEELPPLCLNPVVNVISEQIAVPSTDQSWSFSPLPSFTSFAKADSAPGENLSKVSGSQ